MSSDSKAAVPYALLSQRAQVARLRGSALEVLRAYPFEVQGLRLLNHGFNTTFRVDTTDGQKFALRLNVNSHRGAQQIGAEVAWLTALAQDTPLHVPTPQPTRDGRVVQHVASPDLGRDLAAVLFSWLPGKDLGEKVTVAQMREVGKATALLHAHALKWALPEGTALAVFDRPLMDSPNHLREDHAGLTLEQLEVLDAVMAQADRVLPELFAREVPRVLHGDLHPWNLRWARGKLSILDFDDSLIGVPTQDLIISAYYLRPKVELEEALLEGYASVAPLPPFTPRAFETLLAARNLVLLNDLLVNITAEIRALLPRYVPNSILKLRHFLDTGQYRHDLPGVITA